MSLISYIQNNAENYPDDIFLISGEERYTFSSFHIKVNRFAGGLRELGIKKGDRVGVMLPNIAEWPIAYGALVSLGAVVVPLNIMLKENELRHQLHDCDACAVIFWCGFMNDIIKAAAEGSCDVLIMCGGESIQGVKDFETVADGNADTGMDVPLNDDETCVIFYTSGTTGKPMGAELTHRNILKNAESCSILLPIERSDVILGVIPLFHSFGHTTVLNLAVVSGAKLVLLQRFEPLEVGRIVKEHSPSLFMGVPAMFHAILNDERVPADSFKNVKYCISGAAKLDMKLQEDFEKKFECVILEGYGLTEAGPVVSFNRNVSMRRKGSIGLPIDGVEMKLYDEADNEINRGDVGEIVIRGPSIMKGYLNQPKITEKRLVNGWLRTGDLAKMDDEGYYYFIDRKSDMIIKHGFNVYPKEIENEICSHPNVIECSVIGIKDRSVGEKIKACVVLKNGEVVTEEDLINYCAARLAAFKVPDIVEYMTGLPRNASGKVMKKSLRVLHKN